MRVRDIRLDEMTVAQRRVAQSAVSGKRGHIPAPLRAWLHSPEMGDRAQLLGAFLRYETSLGPALSELAILVTARFWTSHYEWYAHKSEALKAGVSPAVVDAIAQRQMPTLDDPKARAVYDYAMALHISHRVPQAVHDAAMRALGETGVVELVGLLGYYTLVSMTLNAFEIGVPEGEALELED
jgi:4-carboxymuconolactone decarboxylase